MPTNTQNAPKQISVDSSNLDQESPIRQKAPSNHDVEEIVQYLDFKPMAKNYKLKDSSSTQKPVEELEIVLHTSPSTLPSLSPRSSIFSNFRFRNNSIDIKKSLENVKIIDGQSSKQVSLAYFIFLGILVE